MDQTTQRRWIVKNDVQIGGMPVSDIEITRIDFWISQTGTTVNKLGMNEFGRTVVAEGKQHETFDLEGALAWCARNGWTVRRWPGGARAWKNGLEPVRSKQEIIKLRDQLRGNPWPELNGLGVSLDLAYDL